MKQILPSILDIAPDRISEYFQIFKNNDISQLHVDVMDGSFVPSFGFSDRYVAWLHQQTNFYLDVHLMVDDPLTVAPLFVAAGADSITVHANTAKDLYYVISQLNGAHVEAGVALNPDMNPSALTPILPLLNRVLVMTACPGRPSHGVLPNMDKKVEWLNTKRFNDHLNYRIEVDGGIGASNVAPIVQAGCDDFVSGSFITKSPDPVTSITQLKAAIH